MFDSAAFAYSKASEAAERNGSPHSRIITTTPNMLDVPEGAYCYSLIQSAIKFDEAWYSMDKEEVYRIVDKGSKNGFIHIQFSWEELGLSKEWYEKQCRLVNYDLLTIRREILLEWTLSGDGSLFSEEQLDELHNNVKKPIGQFYIDNTYRFLVYEKLYNINTRSYIISVDIAGGLEADNTVVTIIDPLTYKPVASFKSNNIDTVELTDLLVKLVENLFQNSVIVPERNNMGLSVIHMLLKTSIADKIYYELKGQPDGTSTEEPLVPKKRTKDKTIKNKKRIRVYGIDTTTKSRTIMISEILNMIVNERPELCNNDYLYDDIKCLERDKKGKVQARQGMHDDAVMSYLVGLYMILYGKNTSKFIKVTYTGEDEEGNVNKLLNSKVKKYVKTIINISNGKSIDMLEEHRKNISKAREIERMTGIKSNYPFGNDSNDIAINSNNTRTVKRINKFRKFLN